ncbi:MAG: class I SAM-dependent RNA methyltransferase [Desulforhopalus sp.]|jgi:23S rRNA (uracil1939-C5)-methyltransferase|nr:class I SAM-dependent RNA methyltransferase [Desulforhopalus sp.]
MKTATITIKKLVNGGYGLGHLDSGEVVLVRHALPGETARVTITASRKGLLFGQIDHLLSNHPERIPPPCRYYLRCGGCDLQHVSYPSQLALKKELLSELLERSTIALPAPQDLLPSPDQFGYRQRLRLQVDGGGQLGFHRHQSHAVVAVSGCLLAGKSLNHTLTALQDHAAARRMFSQTTALELLLNPCTDRVAAIFHYRRRPRPADLQAAQRLTRDIAECERIFFQGDGWPLTAGGSPSGGQSPFRLEVNYPKIGDTGRDLNLRWEAGGFCQVNLGLNRRLIETVLTFAAAAPGQRLLDLFCGMGNFAIPSGLAGATVLGCEGQGAAIRAATDNARRAGLELVTFRKGAVHQACRQLAEAGERFDCTVLDPPRAGAPQLAPILAELCRDRLVYISCDPATLTRDLEALVGQGFSVRRIQPLDMFPQTHHLETVVLLRR